MKFFFLILFSTITLFAQEVKFEISSQRGSIEPNKAFEIIGEFKIPDGVYIYANEGSQLGLATEVNLKLPPYFRADKFVFPTPKEKIEDGKKVLYYSKDFKIFAKITPAKQIKSDSVEIVADASWLACGKLCIPQNSYYKFTLNLSQIQSDTFERIEADIQDASPESVLFAILGAFFGGIILNLMPCVFPVIGLKILSFTKDADKSRVLAIKNALYYSLGVVLSFVALGLLLVWLKALGNELGWGFQLQEPMFVAFLTLLFCIMALSFAGTFEFGAQFSKLGNIATKESGAKASLLSGVLAVIVASPCTAPFMGSALGLALASSISWLATLLIFASLGIGMAFPYVLISAVPQISRLMPKPGLWMETFKQVLSFPLFATAIWLVWIFTKQRGADSMAELLFAVLSISFALWIFGKYAQPFHKARTRILAYVTLIVCAILSLYLTIDASQNSAVKFAATNDAWSSQKVEALRKEGKIVFVDFTASWCLTCIANKKAVLDLASTREIFRKNNVAFLIADWTNKDPIITKELAKFKRSGVPLNIIYPADLSKDPIILPTILTQNALDEAIDKARQ